MTNEQLALLLDPRREKPGWWAKHIPYSCPHCSRPLHGTHATPPAEDLVGGYRCLSCRVMHTADFTYTGPDYHASDDACFRDWRPVLLAAGYCIYSDSYGFTHVFKQGYQWFGDRTIGKGKNSYRAAILAAVAWLAEHEPTLLREAIARVEGGHNG